MPQIFDIRVPNQEKILSQATDQYAPKWTMQYIFFVQTDSDSTGFGGTLELVIFNTDYVC